MNVKFQLTRAAIVSLVLLAAFSVMAKLVTANKIVEFDNAIIGVIQGLESPLMTVIMKFFTYIGSTKIVIILSLLIIVIVYFVLQDKSELILFTVAVAITPILNSILKNIFQRSRPDLHRLIDIGGYSFPSGHAMNAFTVYGLFAFLLWRHIQSKAGRSVLILSCSMMVILIGISRIYLGVHYPSDIIGGILASGCILGGCIWLFQWYKERQPRLEGEILKRT